MSMTVTYVTLDHRYFMRRTKQEIIARIEEIRGSPMPIDEYRATLAMTKDQLASEAMRLVRQLPSPPDPADQLILVIKSELDRQAQKHDMDAPFVQVDSDDVWRVVGLVNLRELAQAIVKSGVTSV